MRPEDVTDADVIAEALQFAAQLGIHADAIDCSVIREPTNVAVRDSAGPQQVHSVRWVWNVIIVTTTRHGGHSHRYLVPVEFGLGGIAAQRCIDL